jgi:hypothetical protein
MPLNSADGRGHRPEGRKSFCSGGRGCEAPTFRSGRACHTCLGDTRVTTAKGRLRTHAPQQMKPAVVATMQWDGPTAAGRVSISRRSRHGRAATRARVPLVY